MKKILLLGVALGMISGVYAKKVKIRVDMTGQTVNSTRGVSVAGNFQAAAGAGNDWTPGDGALTQEGSTNFYSRIFDIPANRTYEFKFINGNDWNGSNGNIIESVPALLQVGHTNNGGTNDNRWSYIDSTANDTTLIDCAFSAEAPSGKFAVRFAVDMQTQTSVSANGVHIAGSLQGWNPAGTRMVNLFNSNKVYEWIAYLAAGTYQYKFVNGDAWGGDESIPSACNVSNNREINVSASSASKVCFGSCIACPTAPIPRFYATFAIDMTNSDCNGGFDSVSVAGGRAELTNWGSGVKLRQVGSTGVYATTIQLDSGEMQFKFRFHKNGNTNWEGIGNRIWVLSADDTLDLTCFNNSTPGACIPKPAPSDVTFMVDLSNETPDGQGRVYVIGDFTTPNWQSGAIRLTPVAGKPGFYSTTVNICPGSFAFKFMNGDSSVNASEENFSDTTQRGCVSPNGVGGFNRTYTRMSANPVTLAYVFNTCTVADTSTTGLFERANLLNNVKVYPNPTNGLVNVEFNDLAKSHNVIVMDLAGKAIATYSNITDGKLTINSNELAKGMLFVNITNNRGESKIVKLIVQ
jgi:hypothetical protein